MEDLRQKQKKVYFKSVHKIRVIRTVGDGCVIFLRQRATTGKHGEYKGGLMNKCMSYCQDSMTYICSIRYNSGPHQLQQITQTEGRTAWTTQAVSMTFILSSPYMNFTFCPIEPE